MELVLPAWLCWVVILILAAVINVLWQQLWRWKMWKDQMRAWLLRHNQWLTDNCSCPSPDPEDPPDPPSWPNGGWS